MDPHCHHRQPMGFLQALNLRNKLRESDDYDGPKLYVRRCKRCHGWHLTTLWICWSK
jgi:hypothetical protein